MFGSEVIKLIKELIASFNPVKIDIKGDIDLSFLNGNKLIEVSDSGNSVNLDLTKIENKTQEKKIQKLVNLCKEEQSLFLESDAATMLNGIEKSNKEHQKILKFFKGRLKPEDYKLLRISVYIKSLSKRRKPIQKHLDDVSRRYGTRGTNFCNLYSSGYFEAFFKPLWEQLEEEKNLEDIRMFFDTLIEDSPFAIFVGHHTSKLKLRDRITKQLSVNKKYGLPFLNIHGIGSDNVNTISAVIQEFKDRMDLDVNIQEARNNINVYIRILPKPLDI